MGCFTKICILHIHGIVGLGILWLSNALVECLWKGRGIINTIIKDIQGIKIRRKFREHFEVVILKIEELQ
jgi:hypothetical protein